MDDHYTKSPISRHMAKVAYGWTVTILSYLRVNDGHYTKLPTGRCVAKVAYGWTAITLSYLRVDA